MQEELQLAAYQASLSFTISWSLLRLMSIESMMPSNHLILYHPLLLLLSIIPSIRVFSNEFDTLVLASPDSGQRIQPRLWPIELRGQNRALL